MNVIRLIGTALPVMLLLACGRGSSGGTASPTTMMLGTGDPNMPPANPLTVFMPTEGRVAFSGSHKYLLEHPVARNIDLLLIISVCLVVQVQPHQGRKLRQRGEGLQLLQ